MFDETKWSMNDTLMPVVDKTSHIGIKRDSMNSAAATIEENLKKARRSMYSLKHIGLHGEKGLDPITPSVWFIENKSVFLKYETV